jgi:hypothetical protein
MRRRLVDQCQQIGVVHLDLDSCFYELPRQSIATVMVALR